MTHHGDCLFVIASLIYMKNEWSSNDRTNTSGHIMMNHWLFIAH